MKAFHPDALDMQIIEALEDDCSLSYREIAERLGKDMWSVRDRVVLLKRRNIIGKCRAEVNFSEIGYGCRSLMMFNVPAENIDSFISFVRSNRDFKRLIIATGQRRFILECIGKACNDIREYSRKNLAKFGIYDVVFEVILDMPSLS